MRRPFKTNELAIIRQHFPSGGAKKCAELLNGRSERSIQLFAWKQGIKRDMNKLNACRREFMQCINETRRVYPPLHRTLTRQGRADIKEKQSD